jgi:hypothetical protein
MSGGEIDDLKNVIFEDEFGNKVNPIVQVVFDTHQVDKPTFTKSLSAGASLITKLAMVVATYGTFAGTSLLANVSNAAFGTLCGQTACAFIENDANLGRTLKAAASTDTLKAVVRSAATAGIVHGLTSAFSDTVVDAASTRVQAALLVKFSRGNQTLADLARSLETSWPVVARLEDPYHWSTLKQLSKTASALGQKLVLSFEKYE